jgi:hypothetical protein
MAMQWTGFLSVLTYVRPHCVKSLKWMIKLLIFSVPEWGDCRTVPPSYMGWQDVRQPYARVDFIPQSGTKKLATDLLPAPQIGIGMLKRIWREVKNPIWAELVQSQFSGYYLSSWKMFARSNKFLYKTWEENIFLLVLHFTWSRNS